LKDVVSEEEQAVEFSIMIIGGAAAMVVKDEVPPVAQGSSGLDELSKEEFWTDLRSYLVQRLRDEKEGGRAFEVFKAAWELQGR